MAESVPVMNAPGLESGPCRSPYRSVDSPIPQGDTGDVVMEEQVKVSSIPNGLHRVERVTEEAELLLNIASLAQLEPPGTLKEGPHLHHPLPALSPVRPTNATFPYTPPDDRPNHHEDPPPQYTVSTSSTSQLAKHPNSVAEPPTPARATLDTAPRSTKTKRKRNATAGPSVRRTSTERCSNEPDRVPHWMGEDNTAIRCICGVVEDDGFTIQCEACGAWQHGSCFEFEDADSVPEQYFCEICLPRPVDAAKARRTQVELRGGRALGPTTNEPVVPEKPRTRTKPKRARTGSVIDEETELHDQNRDPSLATMGPPTTTKTRRKPTANKPRSKPSMRDYTPGQSGISTRRQSLPPVELEDDFYKVEPWALEYTGIRENVVRGRLARQIMCNVYREWVDADVEEFGMTKRTVTNPSGLPSPTETGVLRLSPDMLFPAPDFGLLAPPVPPVFLSGSELDDHAAPTSIRPISDSPSFLPLNYAEVSTSGVYSRPAIYGVFADDTVSASAFLGEYRGEILDCESYRRDPINQYAGLGTPKPFVHSIGPPVNLMIDARGYGSESRFIRSGCHPNVVLRPLLWRNEAGDPPKISFGIFANRMLSKDEELVLGWEWDDQHVVHFLRPMVLALLLPENRYALPDGAIHTACRKFEAVLTHIFGTFTACACSEAPSCALIQMRNLVEGRDPDLDLRNGKVKVDFGELVGAVRGWRRRELEAESARNWARPSTLDVHFTTSMSGSDTPTYPDREREVSISRDHQVQMQLPLPPLTTTEAPLKDPDRTEVDEAEAHPVSASPSLQPVVPGSSSVPSLVQLLPTESPVADSTEVYPDEENDGNVSDATSATIPRTQFSGSEVDVEEEPVRKGKRRVLSPVKRQPMLTSLPEKRKDVKEVKGNKRENTKKVKLAQKDMSNKIAPRRPSARKAPTTRKHRVIASSASEDEGMDVDKPRRGHNPLYTGPSVPSTKRETEEPRATVSEQIAAPMGEAMEVADVGPDVVVKEVMSTEGARVLGEDVQQREPTPLPENARGPKEPTPPPEPPKKVSISDYLKTRKFKKDNMPASMSMIGESATPTDFNSMDEIPGFGKACANGDDRMKIEPDMTRANAGFVDFLPSSRMSGGMEQPTPPVGTVNLLTESPRPITTPGANFLPRNDYFSPQVSSSFAPRPPNSNFVPRQASMPMDIDTPQASAGSSFNPRQNSVATAIDDTPVRAVFASFTPRALATPLPDDGYNRPSRSPEQPTVPLPVDTPSSVPPVLASREQPPHQRPAPPSGPRITPTGPKQPPAGPRRGWDHPPESTGPTRPGEGSRGNFIPASRTAGSRGRGGFIPAMADRDRGYGDRDGPPGGGFFRGRGGFRGRGR